MTSSYSVSCDDSPLSTTGSVLAILTFVYALLVSTALYLRSGHRANKDTYAIFERFTDDIVDQSIEIQAFTSEHSCTTFRHEDRILQRRMQQILRRAEKSLQVLQDYAGKHRLDFKSDPRWFEKEIIGRAKFVVSFDKINSIRRELGELRNEIRILDLQISIRYLVS
jgi:hypothetical protein